jgi:hypothetical protein
MSGLSGTEKGFVSLFPGLLEPRLLSGAVWAAPPCSKIVPAVGLLFDPPCAAAGGAGAPKELVLRAAASPFVAPGGFF